MQLNDLEPAMQSYLQALSLTTTQDERINSALQNILSLMAGHYNDASIYAQGSYSTDTMVKPLTALQSSGSPGEYDVDIAIERTLWQDAPSTLNEVESILKSDPTYSKMEIETDHSRCVRILYAPDSEDGPGFHIDLVPTQLNNDGTRAVADRDTEKWEPSDAKEFTDWFNNLASQQPGMRNVVIILKRLRDLHKLEDSLKSILVVALVANSYYPNKTVMGDLLGALSDINTLMDPGNPPVIQNPAAAETDDLMEKVENYEDLRQFLDNLEDGIRTAISEEDGEALQEIFGPGFKPGLISSSDDSETKRTARAVTPVSAFGGIDAEAKRE